MPYFPCMKKTSLGLLLALVFSSAQAQEIIRRDPVIEKMANTVHADSLRSYVEKMVSFGTRNTISSQTDSRRGIGAARQWVLQKFLSFAKASGGRMTATIDTVTLPQSRRVDKPVVLGNVVATLKGTDPADRRIFLVTGHLDSRSSDVMNRNNDAPGANDDASGVAAVLECARIMSTQPFPATVIFMAVSGEEQGLLGAAHMAEKSKQDNLDIQAVLNNDIVGSNNSSGTHIINNTQVRVFSEAYSTADTGRTIRTIRSLGLENDGSARQLARYTKEIGERYVPNLQVVMIYRNDRFLRGGDHSPFANAGFPAVRITEMNENYDHQHQDVRKENGIQYGDLAAFMDFEYLRKNTAMNLAVLSSLASSPSRPQQVTLDTRDLTNFTTINWKKSATGSPAGYYVLVRETTRPVWQQKIFVPGTSVQLPYSKDNYFFAVQSVDSAGHESLPVVPLPADN